MRRKSSYIYIVTVVDCQHCVKSSPVCINIDEAPSVRLMSGFSCSLHDSLQAAVVGQRYPRHPDVVQLKSMRLSGP